MSTKQDKADLDPGGAHIRMLGAEEALRLKAELKPDTHTAKHELEPLEVHPLAKLVPEMSAKEYADFRKDLEQNTLLHPVITLYEERFLTVATVIESAAS